MGKSMQRTILLLGVSVLALLGSTLQAQVPQIINYQGRVVVGTTNFNGTGQFRFALVNTNGTTTYWSNDGTSNAGSQPTAAVSLTVSKGLYSVLLGDTTIANMSVAIPASVFNNSDVRLRVWFNDGTTGSQLLAPDQRIASAGYAMNAANIVDGAITAAKIATGAVGSTQLATGAVSTVKIANGAVGATQMASSSIGATQIVDASITAAKIGTGQVVKSVNGLSDAVTLSAGSNISITPSGNTLTLSSTGGGSNFWQLNGSGSIYYGDTGGSVGIGTNAPAAELHIVNSSGNMLRLDGGIPHINFIDTANSNTLTGIGAQAGSFYVTNNQTGNLMQLTAAGFLGIGTTTPVSRVQISGTPDALRLTALHPFITLDDTGAAGPSRIVANVGGMDLKSNGAVSGSNPGGFIHLDTIGTVGIGTATPKHQLSIKYFAGAPTWTSNNWAGALDFDNGAAIGWAANTGGQRFGMGHSNGSFVMWRTAADPGTTGSAANYDFAITDAGSVGVGTITPISKLTVQTVTNAYGLLHTDGSVSVGTFIGTGSSTGGWLGTFSNDKLNFFTNNGSARMTIDTSGNVGIGTSAPTMKLDVNGAIAVNTITIRGGSDLAEPFPMQDQAIENGAVVVIDEQNPGHLKRSMRAYDRRVAGIVSGANGIKPGISLHQEGALEGGQNVALTGRVYVAADTSNGPIEPGDLLTTSDTPGRAMKVTDHTRAQGAVLGKAMTPLSKGDGMVLTLVTLQ